jgi:hypothetical protein
VIKLAYLIVLIADNMAIFGCVGTVQANLCKFQPISRLLPHRVRAFAGFVQNELQVEKQWVRHSLVLLLWVGFPAQSPRQQPAYGVAPGFKAVLKSEVI